MAATQAFIIRARTIHGASAFTYNDSVYTSAFTPIVVQCSAGHTITVMPRAHMAGQACPMCHPPPPVAVTQIMSLPTL